MLNVDKKLELITIEADPYFQRQERATEIVCDFIRRKGLILYGGAAMDYALRLVGEKIYPDEMLKVPDLDFYSPDSVSDAYELADILFEAGFKETRAIKALYVRAMKVDIGDNHFIADISFVPRTIFAKLPFIEYKGMKCIHPVFQKIDIHSSLSFPFDNPPREVIFSRWKKDIERYNLLHSKYPTPPGSPPRFAKISCDLEIFRHVFDESAAYALIYHEYKLLMELTGAENKLPVIAAECKIDGERFIFDSIDKYVNIVHYSLKKAIHQLELKDVRKYYSIINLMPKYLTGEREFDIFKYQIVVKSTENSLIGIYSGKFGGKSYRCVCLQYLMKNFLVKAFLADDESPRKMMYYSLYDSCRAMIIGAGRAFALLESKAPGEVEKIVDSSPFVPAITVYGNDNFSESLEVIFAKVIAENPNAAEHPQIEPVPQSYYPARGNKKPAFDYESSSYFIKDGREKQIK